MEIKSKTRMNNSNTNTDELSLLESLSIDIFQVLNSYLGMKDIITLCLSSKTIYEKYKNGKLLDMKAKMIIDKKAPLAQRVNGDIYHVLLLEREFRTTYRIFPRPLAKQTYTNKDGVLCPGVLRAQFGHAFDGTMFGLRGLPPKSGTIVHITVDVGSSFPGAEIEPYVDLHLTLDDMRFDLENESIEYMGYESFARRIFDSILQEKTKTGPTIGFDLEEEITEEWMNGDYNELCRQEIEKLIKTGISIEHEYQYFQVILP